LYKKYMIKINTGMFLLERNECVKTASEGENIYQELEAHIYHLYN
jgi:hypothetical protein